MAIELDKMRRFSRWALLHKTASSGAVGHVLPDRYVSQAEKHSIMADKKNTQFLCSLNQINCGKLLVNEATVAPMPRVTNRIGKAQQINVLLLVNRLNYVMNKRSGGF